MKITTKVIAALLMLSMLFSLGACAGTTPQPSTSPSTAVTAKSEASAAASPSAEPSVAPSSATVLKTISAGVLTMVTNAEFPPYEFYENEKITGIDAEIAQLIADKLGLKLEIVDTDFEAIGAAVQGGKADIALAGWTITDDRKQSVDFTTSYATGVQVIIVKEGSKIASLDDLMKGGYTIGVQQSTTGDLYTTWDLEDAKLATINRYNKGADAVQALVAGKVDCVVIDNEPAKVFVKANEGLNILDTEYIEEQYAIGYSKTNPELGKAIDTALQGFIADGSVKKIIDKYITAD